MRSCLCEERQLLEERVMEARKLYIMAARRLSGLKLAEFDRTYTRADAARLVYESAYLR